MRTRPLSDWVMLFERIAAPSLDRAGTVELPIARDDPFITWRAMRRPSPKLHTTGRSPADPRGMDTILWGALTAPAAGHPPALAPSQGPITPRGGATPIEVWTETELSALHALWWLDQRGDLDARDAIDRAAGWLIEHIQPDNATNRPWAAHVFALRAAEDPTGEAALFAETLVHNTQAGGGGVPDPMGALILVDAAEAIRKVMQSSGRSGRG